MRDTGLISVIIPCYNCENLIDETLQSLALQTYKNFEVICINDGSRDETINKLKEWETKKAFDIKIIDQENGGVSKARNRGIDEANGEYILFLDADDCYHCEFIERLYNAVCITGADVSYCMLSRNRGNVDCVKLSTDSWYVEQEQLGFMNDLLYRMGDFGFSCYLYKIDVMKTYNLKFDVNTRHFEDREFNWKYLCHCKSAVLIEAPLYWYRVNENSVTQSKNIAWKTEDIEAVIRIEEYLKRHKCEFYSELKSYLLPRIIWSKAKHYAINGRIDLYKRLQKEYDTKNCMKRTAKDNNKLVALSSWLYLIHPMLFYYVVGLKK